jgi:hypothetical protein
LGSKEHWQVFGASAAFRFEVPERMCGNRQKDYKKSAALVAIFQQRPHRSSRVRQSNAMRRRVLLHNGTHFA